MTTVPSALREKEACSKAFLLGKSSSDCTSDGRFASTGHAVQPKDALVRRVLAPRQKLM
jgi:hypothetical protein